MAGGMIGRTYVSLFEERIISEEEIIFEELEEKLNSSILESHPLVYYNTLLEVLEDPFKSTTLKKIMNDTSNYHSYHSPPIMQLSYLVGDLKEIDNCLFYGKNTSISDELGCKILDSMILAGADIYIENYYEDNILKSLSENYMLTRTYNIKFKEKVAEIFRTTRPPVNKKKGKGKCKGKGRSKRRVKTPI